MEKDKKNWIIALLFVVLIFMAICYSIAFQKLRINGIAKVEANWKIKITEIKANEFGTGKNKHLSFTDNIATFSVELEKPGDYVDYIIKVENQGNIDAQLGTVIDTTDKESNYIKHNIVAINVDNTETDSLEGRVLNSGGYDYFKYRIYYNEGDELLSKGETVSNSLVLNYVQKKSK